MKLKYIYVIVFASISLCSARGTEKKEEKEDHEQTNKSATFNENNQPITVNRAVPQANKTDRLKRFPAKERKKFDSGSYGSPSTETKDTSRVDSSDKK